MSGVFTLKAILVRQGESTEEDDYGNPVPVPPLEEFWNAFWEPRESGEATTAQNQVTSGFWLALEGYPDLDAVDAVKLDGLGDDEYQVVGEPGRVPGGYAVPGFTKVAIEKVTG